MLFNSLVNFVNSTFLADFLSILMLYSVFKFILVGIVTEMIWPTQFFNRTVSYLNDTVRYRSYTEYILKLINYSSFYFIYYSSLLNSYFSFKTNITI